MTPVSDYISGFPPDIQQVLNLIRTIVFETAPGVSEGFAYQMPSYKLYGKPLVYFAAFKNHIGFYATPTGHEAFKIKLAQYKRGKGSVQFPLDHPIPYDLIREIGAFRVAENKADNP